MPYVLENLVRRCAWQFGLDLHRLHPERDLTLHLGKLLHRRGIGLVLDVGANEGQYAKSLRQAGYRGRIVSFEPTRAAHALLVGASARDEHWLVANRIALGAEDGTAEINIAGNSVSSSILPTLDSHSSAATDSTYIATEPVTIHRLDDVAPRYMDRETRVLLKIDTQGYEAQVLDGAEQVLAGSEVVQLELSLVPLYEGQACFDALVDRMRSYGFEIWSLWPGFQDPASGRMLQLDGIFVRPASTDVHG